VTLSDVATWKKKDYDIGVNWARDLQIDLEEDLKALRNNRVDDPALIAMEKAYQEQPTKFTSHPYNMPEPSVNNKKNVCVNNNTVVYCNESFCGQQCSLSS